MKNNNEVDKLIESAKNITDEQAKEMTEDLARKWIEKDCHYCNNTGWIKPPDGEYGVYPCGNCGKNMAKTWAIK